MFAAFVVADANETLTARQNSRTNLQLVLLPPHSGITIASISSRSCPQIMRSCISATYNAHITQTDKRDSSGCH
jgi:hypothetical protein